MVQKCKWEAAGARASIRGVGSNQTAPLHFMSRSRISPHRGSNVNKQAVIINFAEDPTLLTSVIHIRWTKKAHRTSQQLVEFTFLIAWEQCVARFNRAFGIEADDASRNGSCLAPVAR